MTAANVETYLLFRFVSELHMSALIEVCMLSVYSSVQRILMMVEHGWPEIVTA